MGTITEKTICLKDGWVATIRSATPRDAAKILTLARANLEEGEFVLSTLEDFRMTQEMEAVWLQANLDDPCKLVIIAEYEGEVLGMLNFANGARKRIAHQGEFSMSVAKTVRDQGIGRALLSTLLTWAREQPTIEKVELQVFANNARAIALYTSLGFKEEGRLSGHIKMAPGVYIDTIEMGQWVKER